MADSVCYVSGDIGDTASSCTGCATGIGEGSTRSPACLIWPPTSVTRNISSTLSYLTQTQELKEIACERFRLSSAHAVIVAEVLT